MIEMPVAEARRNFTNLDETLRKEQYIFVTRHGRRAFALVDTQYFESIMSTMDILSDPEALVNFQKSLEDVREGRLFDHEDIKKEFLEGN